VSQPLSPARFDAVTVVWGEQYRQLFVDLCVPNQATPGNLGALPAGSRYRVFTSPEDAAFLRSHPALREAGALTAVDIIAVPQLADASIDPFVRMTACHRQALLDAAAAGAAMIVLSPDIVISEGTLAAVVRRRERGARAIVCSGVRLERDGFLKTLAATGGPRAMPPRELVGLGLRHLHPFTVAHMADSRRTALDPVGVLWNVRSEGLLARYFYLHPLMVEPPRGDVVLDGTIDQHFVFHTYPSRDDIHLVSDSDELQVFELSHVDAAPRETGPGQISAWRAASVLCRCDPYQQSYWQAPIRLHAGDIGASWRPVEDESARFAEQVTRLRLPALWTYRTSRRVRPYRRKAKELKKRIRRTMKDLNRTWRAHA
jgi:hypothetical protein